MQPEEPCQDNTDESPVCVGAILLRDGAILLGKRASTRPFYPNVWDVIGGHMQAQEQPIDTLRRELQEEIGVTPTRMCLLESLHGPELETYGMSHYHLYVVTAWTGTPRNLQPHEHAEIRWFALPEAAHLDLAHPYYLDVFQRLGQRMESH